MLNVAGGWKLSFGYLRVYQRKSRLSSSQLMTIQMKSQCNDHTARQLSKQRYGSVIFDKTKNKFDEVPKRRRKLQSKIKLFKTDDVAKIFEDKLLGITFPEQYRSYHIINLMLCTFLKRVNILIVLSAEILGKEKRMIVYLYIKMKRQVIQLKN